MELPHFDAYSPLYQWESIPRMIRRVTRELSDAEWEGDQQQASVLRDKLDLLLYKKSIGETHDVNF